MTDYLVDNSIWGRVASGDPAITRRVRRIEQSSSDIFVTCAPQVLEFCYSARSLGEYEQYYQQISLGFPLEQSPAADVLIGVQRRLWMSGRVRAAGAMDILIAGYALVNRATVLAADRDFEHISQVVPLKCEYVASSS